MGRSSQGSADALSILRQPSLPPLLDNNMEKHKGNKYHKVSYCTFMKISKYFRIVWRASFRESASASEKSFTMHSSKSPELLEPIYASFHT